MAKYASGKFAQRISDRSGMAFPYNEMVKEWNGSVVHVSEFERKHPQLEPLPIINDPQALKESRGQIANSTCFVGLIGVMGVAARTTPRQLPGLAQLFPARGHGRDLFANTWRIGGL